MFRNQQRREDAQYRGGGYQGRLVFLWIIFKGLDLASFKITSGGGFLAGFVHRKLTTKMRQNPCNLVEKGIK